MALHDLAGPESPIDSGPGNLSQNDFFEMAKLFHSDQNYFECAHWLQAAMDVENIWPDGIPNIKARIIEPLDGPAWTSGAGTDLNGSVWASLN